MVSRQFNKLLITWSQKPNGNNTSVSVLASEKKNSFQAEEKKIFLKALIRLNSTLMVLFDSFHFLPLPFCFSFFFSIKKNDFS